MSFALSDASMTLGECLVLRKSSLYLIAHQIRSVDEIRKKADRTDEAT